MQYIKSILALHSQMREDKKNTTGKPETKQVVLCLVQCDTAELIKYEWIQLQSSFL